MIIEDNDSEKKEDTFPSAKLFLSVIQKEYDYEANRAKNLESRTGMILAFTGVLLIFIANNIKLVNLRTISVTNTMEALPYNSIIISTVIILFCVISTMYNLYKVISLREYNRLSMDNFSQDCLNQIGSRTEEEAALSLILSYHEVIEYNIKINNDKAKYFSRAITSSFYALFLTVFTYVYYSFMSIS